MNNTSKLILIGCGGVARTLLEMLPASSIDKKYYSTIVIIEPRDLSDEPTIIALKEQCITFRIIQEEITETNIENILPVIQPTDIVVDLSYNVAFQPIVKRCQLVGANYINTSLERWPIQNENKLSIDLYSRSLHLLHTDARKLSETYATTGNNKGPTCILIHGMNPGLITHFTRLAILTVSKKIIDTADTCNITNDTLSLLRTAHTKKEYSALAQLLDVRCIQCSERDTQICNTSRTPGTFMNTWGCYSFYSEGVDPIQLGWGAHESTEHIVDYICTSDASQIIINRRGIDQYAQSYVPVIDKHGHLTDTDGRITGLVIPHSENETTTRDLTIEEKSADFDSSNNRTTIYKPSAYYVYQSCPAARESLDEVKKSNYEMLPSQHAIRGFEITSGEDAVGCLLIFGCDPVEKLLYGKHTDKCSSYWCGSILSIEQTRAAGLKYSGPTTVQVGASLLSAINWMIDNPQNGVCFPEDLPSDVILENSGRWLGCIFNDFVPYHPKSSRYVDLIEKDK